MKYVTSLRVLIVVLATCLCGINADCAPQAQTPAPKSAPFVSIHVVGDDGRAMDLTWGPDGGDITTRYAGGAQEREWFTRSVAFRQGVSGDVYREPEAQVGMLQATRLVLTNEVESLGVSRKYQGAWGSATYYERRDLPTIYKQAGPRGNVLGWAVGNDGFTDMRYEGGYAVAWRTKSGVRFRSAASPSIVSSIPQAPRSLWTRSGMKDGPITAAVAGTTASILVDTGRAGLSVSEGFAERVHGERLPVTSVRGGRIGEQSARFVRLRDIDLAGVRVPSVIATLDSDAVSDMEAGIGLFPGVNLVFERGGLVHPTRERCHAGIPMRADGAIVLLDGPDRTSVNDGTLPRSKTTLLDTGYNGPPQFTRAFSFPVAGVRGAAFASSERSGTCSRVTATVSYRGYPLRLAAPCFVSASPPWREWNVRMGSGLLLYRQMTIDSRDEKVCWSS